MTEGAQWKWRKNWWLSTVFNFIAQVINSNSKTGNFAEMVPVEGMYSKYKICILDSLCSIGERFGRQRQSWEEYERKKFGNNGFGNNN
jgi:hypothetical protein